MPKHREWYIDTVLIKNVYKIILKFVKNFTNAQIVIKYSKMVDEGNKMIKEGNKIIEKGNNKINMFFSLPGRNVGCGYLI
jgi:hypothetical protein